MESLSSDRSSSVTSGIGAFAARRGSLRGGVAFALVVGALAAATAVLWCCFNAPLGKVGLEFPFDFVFYYMPMLQQASERMRAGELPLWNPYQCCGMPLLATAQVAVFYPPTWLTLVLPLTTAIKVFLFGQVVMAGVFATLFMRALGNRWFAAAVGGLLYLFSCVLGQIYWPSEVSTLVWMPFLFWCVERYVQCRRWTWWVLFTVGVAMQLLAGFPQFTVYTFYLLGPYALLRLVGEGRETRRRGEGVRGRGGDARGDGAEQERQQAAAILQTRRAETIPRTGQGETILKTRRAECPPPKKNPCSRFGLVKTSSLRARLGNAHGVVGGVAWLMAGCVVAAGLAAIQLVPMAELARNTARSGSLTEKAVHYLESERGEYFTPLRYFGNMFSPRPKMITFDFPDGSGYLGMVTPLLVCIGVLLGWRDPRVRMLLVAAAIAFLLAFGYSRGSAWAYRIYAHLPTGNMFRTPSRFLLITHFCLVCLATFGLNHVCGGLRELAGRPVRRLLVAALAVGLLFAADAASGELGVRMAAGAVLLVAVAYLGGTRRSLLWAVQGAMAVMLVLDLAGATAPYGSMRDIPVEWGQRQHWGGVSPVNLQQRAEVTRQAGLARVALPGLRPTIVFEPPERYYAITGYEPLLPDRWHLANKAMGGEPGFIMCMVDPDKYGAFYDMASVGWLFRTKISDLAKRRMGPRQWEVHSRVPRPAPAGMSTVLEERPAALPRAYLVGRYAVCSADAALQRMMAADYDHRDGVLLETLPGMPSASDARREPAEVAAYSAERVVVRTQATEPRILVLTDTYFPGWRASVDGAETAVLRANYLFRAVVVPAGTHEVVFEYRPTGFRAGAAASGVSAVVLCALVLVGWRRG